MARLPDRSDRPDDLGAATVAASIDEARTARAAALPAGAPESADGWCLRAHHRLAAGDPEGALDAAARARAADPGDTWADRLASRALGGLGRHAEAVQAAEQAVDREPGLWVNHAVLALASNAEPRRHLVAWEHATRAARLEPTEPGPHLVVGIVAHTGQHEGPARQAYDTVLLLDPTNPVARRNLALLDLDRGRVREAASGLHAAALGDPADAMARANAARVVDVLLGRVSWVTAALLLGSAALLGAAGRSPGASLMCVLLMVATTVFVVGRIRLIDREGLLRLARVDRRLRLWAGCLAAAMVLTALVGVTGSAVVAVGALLLLLVGPTVTVLARD